MKSHERFNVYIPVVVLTFQVLASTILLFAQGKARSVTVFVNGDPDLSAKFMDTCRNIGPKHGIDFNFIDPKKPGKYDYSVWFSVNTEETLGSFVLMNDKGKVLTEALVPGDRNSATSAIAKEFVEMLGDYLGKQSKLQSIRTLSVTGDNQLAKALRDKIETYSCLRFVSGGDEDAELHVFRSPERFAHKVLVSVTIRTNKGDLVWSMDELMTERGFSNIGNKAAIGILRALAKDACPGWTAENERKSR